MNDIYELALELCKNSIDDYKEYYGIKIEDDLIDSEIEDLFFDVFNIPFDYFEKLINVLVPLIEVGKSPLTEKIYQGFAVDGHWLIKKEYS